MKFHRPTKKWNMNDQKLSTKAGDCLCAFVKATDIGHAWKSFVRPLRVQNGINNVRDEGRHNLMMYNGGRHQYGGHDLMTCVAKVAVVIISSSHA